MKIKLDFVTNSSSCCFLLSSPKKITRTQFYDLGFKPHRINEFGCISTVEKLIEFADREPCDWIKKATGPTRFWGMTKEKYNKSKKVIEEGNYIIIVDIERNFDDIDYFQNIIMKMDCKILEKEYD